MSASLIWLIEKAHERRGKYFNSPSVLYWQTAGRVRAHSQEEAIKGAREITGRPFRLLRVTGISIEQK